MGARETLANTSVDEILMGEKPPGIKLGRLNQILGKIGLVLILAVEYKDEKAIRGSEVVWLGSRKRYDERCQRLERE